MAKRYMRHRNSSGNRTVTVVDQNAQQYAKSRLNLGKRKRKVLQKLLRDSICYTNWRYQGLTTLDTAGGYFFCNTNAVTPATTKNLLPLHIVDLTNCPNYTAAGVISDNCHLRLTTSNNTSSATVSFEAPNAQAQGSGGTASGANAFIVERSLNATNNSYFPGQMAMLDWVQLKLMLYGTLTRPVRWRVEVIQLKYDWLHPDFQLTTEVASLNPKYTQERNGFWQYMIKPWITTPINAQQPGYKQMYKVVKTLVDTVIEPKLSTEPNAQATTWPSTGGTALPHQREVNVFYRMQRKCRFDWNTDINVDEGVTTLSWGQNTGDVTTTVHPKARLYLIIRATCPVNNTGALSSSNILTDPTFDILVRKKMVRLGVGT